MAWGSVWGCGTDYVSQSVTPFLLICTTRICSCLSVCVLCSMHSTESRCAVPLVPTLGVCAFTSMCLLTAPRTACVWCREVPTLHPHSLGSQQHALAAVQFPRVGVLSAQVLGSCLGRELGLADVAEVPGQMYGLSCGEERQTGELSLQPGAPWSLEPHLEPLTPWPGPILPHLASIHTFL